MVRFLPAVRRTACVLLALGCSAALFLETASAFEHAEVCRYCRARQDAALRLAEDSKAPEPASRKYAPDRRVDVLHIKIDVTPDFKKETVSATASLRFSPIANDLRELRLDAVDLDVKDVRSSHEIDNWSNSKEHLTIVFKDPIPAGDDATVEVEYTAEPVEGFYFRTPGMGFPETDVHCWTQGETHEARHWIPCFDYPNERATSEIICHVPREMTVVSNGRLVEEQDEPDGMKAVHWLQDKPHVSYLICLIAGRLEKLEDKQGEIPLAFYTQPSKADRAKNAFRDTAKIMEYFQEEIGVPYPWAKYDQCTIADFMWGGMENTTITTLTQRTVYDDETENIIFSHGLDAHELAHQWFGDYVTCKDWSHLWLNEGFATFYAWLYEGHKFGRDAMLYGLYLDARDEIFVFDADKRPIVYRQYDKPSEQFDFRNYPKGAWVLHMLRSQLGEELFRQAIHTYLERYALSEVETEDLRGVFEELSGKPLDKFFDQWLYHGGHPKLKVEYEWRAKEKVAKVSVEQTQQTGDDVLIFEFPSKLRFVVDGKPIDYAVEITKKQHDFYFKLPAEPEIVRFDPEYSVLATVDFKLSDKLLLQQLKHADTIGQILACEALAVRQKKSVISALKEALNEAEFFGVRQAAAKALRQVGTKDAVAALMDSLEQDDARVRMTVVEELGGCYSDDVPEKLAEIVENEKNPAIVGAAVRQLGKFGGAATAEAVRTALADKSYSDRPVSGAFAAIAELNDGQFADDVMKVLREREKEIDSRYLGEGMKALAKISRRGKKQEKAYRFLADYLDHPRAVLRISAIAALGELHDQRAVGLIEPYLAPNANDRFRVHAKAAMKQLEEAAPSPPGEVVELRKALRELRAEQQKLERRFEALNVEDGDANDD